MCVLLDSNRQMGNKTQTTGSISLVNKDCSSSDSYCSLLDIVCCKLVPNSGD